VEKMSGQSQPRFCVLPFYLALPFTFFAGHLLLACLLALAASFLLCSQRQPPTTHLVAELDDKDSFFFRIATNSRFLVAPSHPTLTTASLRIPLSAGPIHPTSPFLFFFFFFFFFF